MYHFSYKAEDNPLENCSFRQKNLFSIECTHSLLIVYTSSSRM